ncbi:MAG TPA: tetratricopeptide repeat protein [Chitinophagales bacterium]|nr:tetratricopeptide repeat protein [Chitinophagales bacterium]
MNAQQLLKQIRINRDLIISHNLHAYEHLQMLKGDYPHLANEEVTISIELNNTLAELHYHSNYAGALQNSLHVVSQYSDTIHKNLLVLHLKVIGHCYTNTGEFRLAEDFLLRALSNLEASHAEYVLAKADILQTLAMNHEMIEEGSPKSIDYLTEAIEGLDEETHAVKRANCLMGLGNVYNNMDNIPMALKYYTQAAQTFEGKFVLSNMASAYSNIGNCHIKLGDFKKAETYLQKSLELRLKFSSPDDLSISYYNLAIVYKETGDYIKAEDFLIKSKQILEQIGNKPYISEVNDRLQELEVLRAKANKIS